MDHENNIFKENNLDREEIHFLLTEGLKSINLNEKDLVETAFGFTISDSEIHISIRDDSHGSPKLYVYGNQLVMDSNDPENHEYNISERIYGSFEISDYIYAVRTLIISYATFMCDSHLQKAFDNLHKEK